MRSSGESDEERTDRVHKELIHGAEWARQWRWNPIIMCDRRVKERPNGRIDDAA